MKQPLRHNHLEAIRGLASLVVVLHHSLLAFAPSLTGFLPGDRNVSSWANSPLFFLLNGQGAVILFFVLSGFVLPLGYFRSGQLEVAAASVIKRIPRLYLPVAAAILLSWLAFKTGSYAFTRAGQLSGSGWLQDFGFVNVSTLVPSFSAALSETLTVFAYGGSKFDGVLWTMRPELFGSFVALAVAPLLLPEGWVRAQVVLFGLMVLSAHFVGYFMLPFVLGVGLAALLHRHPIELGVAAGVTSVVAGLLLIGYIEPIGVFSFLRPIVERTVGAIPQPWIIINAVGAILVIAGVHLTPALRTSLGSGLGRLLGRYSFPLYLVHSVVIGSVASRLYLNWHARGLTDGMLVAAVVGVVFLVSFIVATPLALLDSWWVSALNAATKRLFRPAASNRPSA